MRSTALRKVLHGIVASMVPAASFLGCGDDQDCYGQEGQSQHFRTIDEKGYLVDDSTSPPVIPDGGTDAMDAGTDAGEDGGVPTCRLACSGGYGCTGEVLRECSILGHSSGRWYFRCDYDVHPLCMPKGTICGRRPAGWMPAPSERRPSGGALAALLSQQAALEAASVPAFQMLARELEAHGAPRVLCRAAKRAAADEVRHARRMSDLARRRGGSINASRIRHKGVRALSRIAVDNCVEGCVRETFGAMVAMWQAREAKDPEIQAVMQRIAVDELRHAVLAFRVAEWIETRLDSKQLASVERARRRAIAELRREVAWEPPRELVSAAGLPTANHARELLDRASGIVWTAG
jgi:hypothetical protein